VTSSRPTSRPLRQRRVAVTAALAGGTLLLGACSTGAPGVAAEVGDARITTSDVDEFAEVLCALNTGSGGTPTRQVRFSALQILLSNALAEEVADLDSVDGAAVDAAVEQANATREMVPAALQDTFDEVVVDYAVAQYAVIDLGRESLEEQGEDPGAITDDAAYTEGDRLRAVYAEDAGVEVDPRFGTMEEGVLQAGDGSLAVPVSDFAVSAASPEGGESLVGQLPASQKCGA
jgi:hypothetical protein